MLTDFTYGRSKASVQAMINDVQADIDRIIKIIDGDKYTELRKIADANWSGTDKEAFFKDLDTKRQTLKSGLIGLKAKATSVIQQDYENFKKAQSNMYKAK